jgi:succinate dehydrogenase / fumarate reductase iron-sulfur subunit
MSDARRVEFRIFRYDPDKDARPYFQHYDLTPDAGESMVLDALVRIKSFDDDSLSFRRSCREGVCGSDGILWCGPFPGCRSFGT